MLKINQKVLVDVEPRVDLPSKWEKGTIIDTREINDRLNYFIEFDNGTCGCYPEKVVKAI